MLAAVAKDEGADVHPSRPLAHHRVPHGRGVAGALDPVPRRRDRAVLPGDAGVDELALRGDPTRPVSMKNTATAPHIQAR